MNITESFKNNGKSLMEILEVYLKMVINSEKR